MTAPQHPIARIVIAELNLRASVDAAIMAFSKAGAPVILESSQSNAPHGRFTILACNPAQTWTFHSWESGCPFRALEEQTSACPAVEAIGTHLPFLAGWIGYFSYEAGLRTEGLVSRHGKPGDQLLAKFNLYDHAAIYDHQSHKWYATAVDWPANCGYTRPSVAQRVDQLKARLGSTPRASCDRVVAPSPAATPNMSREHYLVMVRRAKRYIETGDIYQVNLTQRFAVPTSDSSIELYMKLRESNPSSHSAYLPWDGVDILCASPELFVDLRHGHVVTRPIKGTAPRGADQQADRTNRQSLASSEKDRAELNMIVDLLRNDLGRVCHHGSVRVRDMGSIEMHPTVFHRVATIEGDLSGGNGWCQLMRAAFPGGSITGVPKIRAMEIIDELEPTPRGVYCGSIGWIGLDGSMSMNIAIRTMVLREGIAYVYAGGAITADSKPECEYDETLDKAKGMFRALGSEGPLARHRESEVIVS